MPYDTIVDAPALAAHNDDPNWVVIDCRHLLSDFEAGRRLYAQGHIPGAFFADVERDLAGERTGANGRHPLPDSSVFAAFLRDRGVSDETQIVAYDAGGDMFAARLWLLAKWIGHEAVAVLDGGLRAWEADGNPVTTELPPQRAAGNLHVKRNDALLVNAQYVAENLENPSMRLIDARAADRFAGQNETIDPVAGHIPGARNYPFKENFGDDLRFRTAEALLRRFEELGAPRQIVHQCGSGVSAAVNMLAMEIAGLRGSRIYAGSWSEWIADPSHPVATGER